MLKKSVIISLLISWWFCPLSLADIILPLNTLKSQGNTQHCWAYSTSFLLESRSLIRNRLEFTFDLERDVKYWVDYERFMYNFSHKKKFFLGEHEGGWQIEFWESLLKHGKPILYSKRTSSVSLSNFPDSQIYQLDFFDVKRVPEGTDLTFSEVNGLITQVHSRMKAHKIVISFLNGIYGRPLKSTKWMQTEIDLCY